MTGSNLDAIQFILKGLNNMWKKISSTKPDPFPMPVMPKNPPAPGSGFTKNELLAKIMQATMMHLLAQMQAANLPGVPVLDAFGRTIQAFGNETGHMQRHPK